MTFLIPLPQADTRLVKKSKFHSILRASFWVDENPHEIVGLLDIACHHASFAGVRVKKKISNYIGTLIIANATLKGTNLL